MAAPEKARLDKPDSPNKPDPKTRQAEILRLEDELDAEATALKKAGNYTGEERKRIRDRKRELDDEYNELDSQLDAQAIPQLVAEQARVMEFRAAHLEDPDNDDKMLAYDEAGEALTSRVEDQPDSVLKELANPENDYPVGLRNRAGRIYNRRHPPPPPPELNRRRASHDSPEHKLYTDLVTAAGFDDKEYRLAAFDNGQRYGSLLTDWYSDGYSGVQSALVNGRLDDDYAGPIIYAFDEAMIPAPTDITLFRGSTRLRTNSGTDLPKPGTRLTTKMFQSTTTDPVTAMEFTRSAGAVVGPIAKDDTTSYPIFRINVKKDSLILPLPGSNNEREVLIHRDSELVVTGVSTIESPDGPIEVVDVELIS
jgi:hypothetical protein